MSTPVAAVPISDGLINVEAGLGTSRDKAAHTTYALPQFFTPEHLLNAYRTSWLARAIVDYPAEDATRKWRAWRTEPDSITKLEAEERRLSLQKRTQDALIAARLYGGAAIYISMLGEDPAKPLVPGGRIVSLTVMTPQILSAGEVDKDIMSVGYGKPTVYTVQPRDGKEPVKIHPSRLVIFEGDGVPSDPGSVASPQSWGGDSVLQATMAALLNNDGTMANIASLVYEANVDVVKFFNLANDMKDPSAEAAFIKRANVQLRMKGNNRLLMLDSEDSYERNPIAFAGLTDIARMFNEVMSGAARIPITRLFGRSTAGLSGSGDGDERVYYDRIGHMQSLEITPALRLLDDCIVAQALGRNRKSGDIHTQWLPLRQLTEAERAEIFSKTAAAARSIAGGTLDIIPADALSDALVNELSEQGVLPGLAERVAHYGSRGDQGIDEDDLPEPDEDEILR